MNNLHKSGQFKYFKSKSDKFNAATQNLHLSISLFTKKKLK